MENKLVKNKVKCKECGWKGFREQVLEGRNPFDPEEKIDGCPICKDINSIIGCCYYEDCYNEPGAGTSLNNGDYMWSCYKHHPKEFYKK